MLTPKRKELSMGIKRWRGGRTKREWMGRQRWGDGEEITQEGTEVCGGGWGGGGVNVQ